MRLIDANELDDFRFKENGREWRTIANAVIDGIQAFAPTVDAVEVVHGRWHDVALRYTEVKEECSVCHGVVRVYGFRYCPNCGAKMDGDPG